MNTIKIKNYIKVCLIGSSLVFLSSCSKYLDEAPDNRTEINTTDKIAQLVASAYPKASYAAMLNSRVDYVTDKGTGYEHDNNTYPFFWRDVPSSSQDTPDYFWSKCYFSISEVNHAIESYENLGKPQNAKPFIGEALMIRSFSHFLLVSLYSQMYEVGATNNTPGVPYVTEPERVVIKQYERGTVSDVWSKVEKDMLDGMKLLGGDDLYKASRYHFTKKAANAYATRFYLYKGEWLKVIEFANAIIPVATLNANGNVDVNSPANLYAKNNFQPWLTYYAQVQSSDDIKNMYTKGDNPSNLLLTEMSSRMSRYANTWRYGCSSSDVSQTVKAKNATGGSWGYRSYSSSSTHYYLPKYREHFVRTSINATTGTIYTIFPYFRNEEVLLNRAEAYVMMDNFDGALADLNIFCRHRVTSYNETTHVLTLAKLVAHYKQELLNADNFLLKYNAYGSATWTDEKKALILFILESRRNEFMWEGLRYWDVVRYKIPVTHKTYEGETNTLFPGDDRLVLQIPESAKLSGLELNPRKKILSKIW